MILWIHQIIPIHLFTYIGFSIVAKGNYSLSISIHITICCRCSFNVVLFIFVFCYANNAVCIILCCLSLWQSSIRRVQWRREDIRSTFVYHCPFYCSFVIGNGFSVIIMVESFHIELILQLNCAFIWNEFNRLQAVFLFNWFDMCDRGDEVLGALCFIKCYLKFY